METSQADLDADDRRFGADARFTQGPEGRDSMWAGGQSPLTSSRPHVDTEPYGRRPASQGTQLPLGTEGAFKPNDPVQHFVRLKHPHLAEDYTFHKSGDDHGGHAIHVQHHDAGEVGYLLWSGKHAVSGEAPGEEGYAPGEIQGVSVHPQHRGKGLSTALWDYAKAHTALYGSQEPVHSKDRSTAGNHWAHFVGGASMARTEGHDVAEHFTNDWPNR